MANMKNVPNALCITRIILIPFILIFLLPNPVSNLLPLWVCILISGLIYGVAMLTDLFDGKIARKYNVVSDFGKFIDPIADKLLVISIFTAFTDLELFSCIPVIIMLAREFLVTGLRLAAVGKGAVVPANIWGKIKTMIQGISLGASFVILLTASLLSPQLTEISAAMSPVPGVFAWLCAAVTAISAIPYYNSMKKYLK